jgi:hypothetical protein
VGKAVRLEVGIGVAVIRDDTGEVVGHLADGRESPLEHCIVDGYRFRGRVIAVQEGAGSVEVSGRKP